MTTSAEIKPKNRGTKKLFENPVLEKLSRTHISVPITVIVTYAVVLLYWSVTHTTLSAAMTVALFSAGFLIWTWMEYVLHRYVFHMKTFSELRKKIQYNMHGIHHEFPKDKSRLAMPPLITVTLGTILLLIFRVILGDMTFAFLPGIMAGYSLYLAIHYMVHAFPPPRNFFKALWVNHSIHHYKNGDVVFGVSSPFWDYVYRTGEKH